MDEQQTIVRAKHDHDELYTIADQPMDLTTTITLDEEKLSLIAASREGHVIPIMELIDNYEDFENYYRKKLAFNYSLDGHEKFPVNFLLLDATISDIQSPDNNGGMVLGGSLAFPSMYSSTLPIDELSPCGGYRKILDHDAPIHFVMGQPHAFSHSLKHSRVDASHPLITRHSKINPQILFPDGSIRGTGGVPPPKYADLAKNAILHGHVIDNESMYPEGSYSTITEILSADSSGHGGVKSKHLVALPNKSWPRQWYRGRKTCDREQGAVVELGDYATDMYDFIDQNNASRSTNFKKCGIWWNAETLKKVPQIKAKLSMRIVPIVPKHADGKELIPYNNFVKHLSSVITTVDKPFKN